MEQRWIGGGFLGKWQSECGGPRGISVAPSFTRTETLHVMNLEPFASSIGIPAVSMDFAVIEKYSMLERGGSRAMGEKSVAERMGERFLLKGEGGR